MSKLFEEYRAEIDGLVDSFKDSEVVSFDFERTVVEEPSDDGIWRKYKAGNDVYIRIHLREPLRTGSDEPTRETCPDGCLAIKETQGIDETGRIEKRRPNK